MRAELHFHPMTDSLKIKKTNKVKGVLAENYCIYIYEKKPRLCCFYARTYVCTCTMGRGTFQRASVACFSIPASEWKRDRVNGTRHRDVNADTRHRGMRHATWGRRMPKMINAGDDLSASGSDAETSCLHAYVIYLIRYYTGKIAHCQLCFVTIAIHSPRSVSLKQCFSHRADYRIINNNMPALRFTKYVWDNTFA